MSQYLEKEADGFSSIEALSKMFEDVEVESKEKSAAMQERTFDLSSFGHRFYHEAPNDLFELLSLQFSYVDKDGDGYVSYDDFERSLSSLKLDVSRQDVTQIISLLDKNKNGYLAF